MEHLTQRLSFSVFVSLGLFLDLSLSLHLTATHLPLLPPSPPSLPCTSSSSFFSSFSSLPPLGCVCLAKLLGKLWSLFLTLLNLTCPLPFPVRTFILGRVCPVLGGQHILTEQGLSVVQETFPLILDLVYLIHSLSCVSVTLSASEMGVPTYLPRLAHMLLSVFSMAFTQSPSLWIPYLMLGLCQFICGTFTAGEHLGRDAWLSMVKLW